MIGAGYNSPMDKLFRDVEGDCIAPQGSVVCIGAFDGLHRGHQALVGHVRARARALGLKAVALSFEPLPREYFAPADPPARLLLPRARFEGLCRLGMDAVGLLRFNAAMAAMSPEAFVEKVLVKRLAAREVWVGPGFRFGHRRAGDLATLQALGAKHGFEATEVAVVADGGERVSASAVRAQLAAGDLDAAARALGRRYAIAGTVVRGKQLGRQLGYPSSRSGCTASAPNRAPAWPAWARGRRCRVSSPCSRHMCSTSTATSTEAASRWSSSPSCATRKNSTTCRPWSARWTRIPGRPGAFCATTWKHPE